MAFNAPKINSIDVSGIASGLRDSMRQLREDNQRAWQQQLEGLKMAGEAGKAYNEYLDNEKNNEAVKAYLKLLQDDQSDDEAIKELQQRIAKLKGDVSDDITRLASTASYNMSGYNPSMANYSKFLSNPFRKFGSKAGF